MSTKPCIGITIGDFNGIGPELVLKTLGNELVFNYCTPVVYANAYVLKYYADLLELSPLDLNTVKRKQDIKEGVVNLRVCNVDRLNITPGEASTEAGKFAYEFLDPESAETSEDKKTKKIGLDGTFDMKDLLVHDNGEFNVVLEDNYINVVTYTSANGVQSSTTYYNSNFIVYTSVNSDGEQTDALLVPKRQKFANSPLRGSHSRLITEDNIFFLYNDDITNFKERKKKRSPDKMKVLTKMKKAVAVLAYFEDGKLVRKELFKAKKIKNSMPNPESALTLLSKIAMDKEEGHMKYPIYNFKFDKRLNDLI